MKNRPENRLLYPDFLKGIAVLLMIQVHLMELFATEEIYASSIGKISLFLGSVPAAPIFMVVMGYFAGRASQTMQSIIRGLKIMLLGLILNIGFNAHLLIKIYQGTFHLNPLHYIFGADILFLAGISLIFIAILKRLFHEQLALWLLLTVLMASMGSFLPNYTGQSDWVYYLQALCYGNLSWSYFPIFPWLVYPLLGLVFQLIEKKHPLFLNKLQQSNLILVGLIVLNIPFLMYGFTITTHLPAYYHHTAGFVMWAMLFMACWIVLFYKIHKLIFNSLANTYLCWVGKNVTTFYVFQWLLIGNIGTALFRTQSLPMLLGWFIIISFVSSLLVLCWRLIRQI